MIDAAKSMMPPEDDAAAIPKDARVNNVLIEKKEELVKEATTLLKRLADRGYPDAQYFLADCYANGIGTVRGRQDFDRAFPLFVLAAKHGHPVRERVASTDGGVDGRAQRLCSSTSRCQARSGHVRL